VRLAGGRPPLRRDSLGGKRAAHGDSTVTRAQVRGWAYYLGIAAIYVLLAVAWSLIANRLARPSAALKSLPIVAAALVLVATLLESSLRHPRRSILASVAPPTGSVALAALAQAILFRFPVASIAIWPLAAFVISALFGLVIAGAARALAPHRDLAT
jgi:hypothetical protein